MLPKNIEFEWTDVAFQEQQRGTPALLIFGAAALFVFLVLVAQYESWKLPIAIVLIVPMCILASVIGLLARGMPIDILAQIGFVVLVGLAAKNAILIVEFARQKEDSGATPGDAAVHAARTRLRPILMTSLAFILGVAPLAVATGAGAEMRQSLGTAVLLGMLGVTCFGLLFTPAFYTFIRNPSRKERLDLRPASRVGGRASTILSSLRLFSVRLTRISILPLHLRASARPKRQLRQRALNFCRQLIWTRRPQLCTRALRIRLVLLRMVFQATAAVNESTR